jgi:hypothetical protein
MSDENQRLGVDTNEKKSEEVEAKNINRTASPTEAWKTLKNSGLG